jgi:hypothetical protein
MRGADRFRPPQQTIRERHRISSARPLRLKGGILVMRIALASSLVLSLAFTPLLARAAAPATPSGLQQQDNSQNAPQYPSQDYPQQQQGNPPPDNSQPQGNPPPQDNSQAQNNSQGGAGYQAFTPDQLDNLLSPIALYPDPLLAQVFVAATFPDQVEEAARYVRGNGTNGVDEQSWDVSVRAVAHYPTVVEMMADKIDWTTSLGQAYVNQSTDLSAAVQRLRHQAKGVGNLESNQQQEVLENDNYIAINPYSPQYLYVPVYDPAIIYFRRPYWGPAITFGFGFPIGGWLNLGFHWGWGGGFGGVYYTGWNPLGWGRGCWNCGWIGRSRGFVNFHNNVYVNNRFNNININRGVLNRSVNANNLNRFNNIHRNVNYNNVQANNARVNGGGNNGRGFAVANNAGFRGAQNNAPRGNNFSGNRPGGNANLDRNINNNSRANEFRGRDNTTVNNRPGNTQQNRGLQQASRPAQQNSAPHAFGHSEGNFNAKQSSERGQSSRAQAQRPAPQARQAAPRQSSHGASHAPSHAAAHSAPSHGGGGEKHK